MWGAGVLGWGLEDSLAGVEERGRHGKRSEAGRWLEVQSCENLTAGPVYWRLGGSGGLQGVGDLC